MNSGIQSFFESLAMRKWKENDLSDVTYAALQSNRDLKQFFLDYFFPGANLKASHVVIEREHATALGRPDFWITENPGSGNERLFIVEVKIWDHNHHFEQYFDILNKGKPLLEGDDAKRETWRRLGYISNYNVDEKVSQPYSVGGSCSVREIGCRVTTWADFEKELRKRVWESDSLSMGYLSFLATVCPHDDFALEDWKYDPYDFAYIRAFAKAIHNVNGLAADASFIPGGVKAYNRSSRQFGTKWRMGQYFEYKREDETGIWGWIGAYYDNDGARICIEFEDNDGWGKVVCDQYRKYVANGVLRFYLTKQLVEDVQQLKLDELENQMLSRLQRFWQSVMSYVECDDRVDFDWWTFDKGAAEPNRPILSMKALPVFLESVVFAGVSKNFDFGELGKFELVLGDAKGDQEVPEGHCGRYFELRKIDEMSSEDASTGKTSGETIQGWMGAIYNLQKGNAYATPRFEIELNRPFATLLQAENKGWYQDPWGWTSISVGSGVQAQSDLVNAIIGKFAGLQNASR